MNKILSLIIAFALIFGMNISVFASPTPFVTNPLTDEEQATFIENSPVKKIDSMDWTNPIHFFDVNEDEMILVIFSRSSEYAVCVYNSDFEFQYGFSFEAYGTVACEWSGDDIMVYFVRGDIYAKLDQNGQWVEINKVPYSYENDKLKNSNLYGKREIIVNDTTYKIQNDMGILNYVQDQHSFSKLVKIDKNDNATILYDVSTEQTIRTIMVLIIIIGLIITAYCTLIKPIIDTAKKNKK